MTQALLLFTVATLLLTGDLEALIFNDGQMELEAPGHTYILPKEQVRKLRNALNSPEVVKILEQD